MTAKKRENTPDKRREYDDAFKAEVGSIEVAHAPEVRDLRARLKRAEQELDSLKKALVIFGQPTR